MLLSHLAALPLCLWMNFVIPVDGLPNQALQPGQYGTTITILAPDHTYTATYLRIFCSDVGRLTCQMHHTLRVIWANYGRTSSKACPGPKGSVEFVTCDYHAQIYTAHTQKICNNLQKCDYHFPRADLRDPCYGTLKYFEVHYNCERCTSTSWGSQCEHRCHCLLGSCDSYHGRCPKDACDNGWRGDHCQTPCPVWFYGEGCTKRCSEFCKKCDRSLGCTECKPGRRQLPDCRKNCPPGTYGSGCRECGQCKICDAFSGTCPAGCYPGYMGLWCNTTCPGGLHGGNCKLRCGQCAEDLLCDYATGACPHGCKFGFVGNYCSQNIILSLLFVSTPCAILILWHWLSWFAVINSSFRCCQVANSLYG